jgi:ABC-type phosphate/phosphonate transport system substrate-binding protein
VRLNNDHIDLYGEPSMKKLVTTLTLLSVIVLAGCATAATPAPTEAPATEKPTEAAATEAPTEAATEAGKAIVIGDIGNDPAQIIEGAQPFATWLAGQLKDQGITEGVVKVASSDEEMANMLKNGEVDLYFDSVYPAALIADAAGAEPLVRRWRFGVGEYHAVIFVSKASGLKALDDLKGHMLAFDNRYSTSGYMLPLAYLVEKGYTLVEKQSPSDEVSDDEIGYVFSDSDDTTMQWTVSGLVVGGVTDNVSFGRLDQSIQDQMSILAETEDVPRQVGMIRPGIDADLKAAIKKVLLGADKDSTALDAMKTFANTTKFDDAPQGIDEAFKRIHELIAIVKKAEEANK